MGLLGRALRGTPTSSSLFSHCGSRGVGDPSGAALCWLGGEARWTKLLGTQKSDSSDSGDQEASVSEVP